MITKMEDLKRQLRLLWLDYDHEVTRHKVHMDTIFDSMKKVQQKIMAEEDATGRKG